ncbi:MAG: MipA/OmpV family protein [Paracoccus sp. (in: a-proteobacteria)]
MKSVLSLTIAALAVMALSAPADAQQIRPLGSNEVGIDVGIGAAYKPKYPGSDEYDTGPWFILRDLRLNGAGEGEGTGFRISPNVGMEGSRDSGDSDRLTGMDDIDRTYEAGLKATYNMDRITAYGTMRKGFGGHHGIVGEFGAKYRFEPLERLTLWAGLEAGYGDSDFNQTYFGVSKNEATRSGYSVYEPEGGINFASARFEARYDFTPNTALLGEFRYRRITGDSADSPIVADKSQPSIRLGIVRKLNFNF